MWTTGWARLNLLSNVVKLDEFCLYCDTDSCKLRDGFNLKIIEDYNKKVYATIEKVCYERGIPKTRFSPKDKDGVPHTLGLFELDGEYSEFIHNGAKKYAYRKKKDGSLHITVSGVPKKGVSALKSLEDFKDNLVFSHKDTGKNLLVYNDDMISIELEDYQGNIELLKNKYGCVIVPTTYVLGKSQDYANLISDNSESRAIFVEEG